MWPISFLNGQKPKLNAGAVISPYFQQVFEKIRDKWRVNERLAARYWRFAGILLLRGDDGKPQASAINDPERLQQADQCLERAARLHQNSGENPGRQRIAARLRALQGT